MLQEEILDFLKSAGFDCQTDFCYGLTYIRCTLQNGSPAAVLPFSIDSASIEEAEQKADASSQVIREILEQTGEYPLIIAEDRWRLQGECIRQRLLAHMEIFDQIYARNCEVKKIDKATAATFLEVNHSYGDASCRHRYGLYLKRHTGHNAADGTGHIPGTLMAVATFSNARRWQKGDKTIRSYEWTRYASLPGVRLNGGMGKLLKAFITDVKPDDIMTYADLEWSQGKVYEKLGFTLEGEKTPVTFSIDTNTWTRHASRADGERFFTNFGSNKYRLKLTDYQ